MNLTRTKEGSATTEDCRDCGWISEERLDSKVKEQVELFAEQVSCVLRWAVSACYPLASANIM